MRDEAVLKSVAVFPLPDAVLFPGQRMPLHIFEPRYREMVRDLIDGTLAYVVIARTLAANDPDGDDFARVATAGRLVAHEALADGRFHVLIEGVHRVSAHEIDSDKMYRKVQCEALPEPEGEAARLSETDGLSLRAVLEALITTLQKVNPRVRYSPAADLSAASLAWNIAAHLVPDPDDRQRILEADSATERAALTTDALAEVLSKLSPKPPEGAN